MAKNNSTLSRQPDNCTTVDSYQALQWYARGWMARTLGNLIVVGKPGTGKSQTILQAIGHQDFLLIQGQTTPVNCYRKIYEFVQGDDGPIFFDDADSLFQTLAGQNLMKELMIDKEDRLITWGTDYARLEKLGIPTEFKMGNPVCVILNRWKTFNEHVEAVRNRGRMIFFDPTPQQVHDYVFDWFPISDEAKEVYHFVGRLLALIRQPSIREFYEAPLKEYLTELEIGPNPGGNWQRSILKKLVKDKALQAVLLHADTKNYRSNRERSLAYEKAGHGHPRTYYRWINKLRVMDIDVDDESDQ